MLTFLVFSMFGKYSQNILSDVGKDHLPQNQFFKDIPFLVEHSPEKDLSVILEIALFWDNTKLFAFTFSKCFFLIYD
eukprot:UN02646